VQTFAEKKNGIPHKTDPRVLLELEVSTAPAALVAAKVTVCEMLSPSTNVNVIGPIVEDVPPAASITAYQLSR
jgi:hypothetical protein